MKTCPACHRSVPDDAMVCPHAGCGKPLPGPSAGGAKKRPPPPGKVQLTTAAQSARSSGGAAGSAAGGEGSRRGPLATIALLLLLVLLIGGIYYAAVISKPTQPQHVEQIAAQANASQQKPQATKPEKPQADAAESGATKAEPNQPNSAPSPVIGKMPPAEGEKEATEVAAAATPSQPLGLYSERTRPDREQWIAGVGGTPVSETAVAAGLEWLARHQAEDGHWGPDCLGPNGSRCEKEHSCSVPGGPYEAAQTGLALLAFQAGGNYDFNGKPYSDNVRHGLDWFVDRQGPNGELVGSTNHLGKNPGEPVKYDQHYMYEHAIGTFALAEACAVARAAGRHPDERYLTAASKAVEFIESQQHNDGGWRYTPEKWAPSDSSVSGWSMLALKTAREAELPVKDETISRMTAFFKRQSDPLTGRTHYQGTTYVTDATTGVGIMVDEFIEHHPDSDLVHLGAEYLAGQAEQEWGKERKRPSDFYLWYNCTLAMFMAGGDTWDRWNNVIRDYLVSLQIHGDECNRGSWEPNDRWGVVAGRVYSTALSVLTLEVYYRFAREKAAQGSEKPK